MESTEPKLQELVGGDLSKFGVTWMTEVYRIDPDGRKSASLGFFRDENTAMVFTGVLPDAKHHRTKQALVLTNGKVGYVIDREDPVKLFNDEQEAVELRKIAIAKLTSAEQKLLGF